MQTKFLNSTLQKTAKKDTYKFLASTSSVDRQGDSVDQSGWDLSKYMTNPVILWAHKYDELPLGKATLQVTQRGLEAEIEFADVEGNPKAQQVKNLVDQGILNAVSVGFMAKERNGNVITKSELLEISIVPVPANQDAIRLSVKGLGNEIESEIESDIAEALEIEKGAVGDVLSEEQIREQKYANMSSVYDVIYALGTAYFDEGATVDSFPTLLTETIGILGQIAGGGVVDAGIKEANKSLVDAFIAKHFDLEEKSGRVFSGKNVKALQTAVDSFKAGLSEIEKLLETGVATTDEIAEEESKTVIVPKEMIEELIYSMRSRNKGDEKLLSALKLINK